MATKMYIVMATPTITIRLHVTDTRHAVLAVSHPRRHWVKQASLAHLDQVNGWPCGGARYPVDVHQCTLGSDQAMQALVEQWAAVATHPC